MMETVKQPTKRLLMNTAGLLALVGHAFGTAVAAGGDTDGQFTAIDLVMVVDAVPGAEMRGVAFYNERGGEIYGSGVVKQRNREVLALGSRQIPGTVRVIWRENPKPVWGKSGGIDYEGPIIGDYLVEVAQRIPDDVLTDIRAHGGSLRIKFRLKPDGVLFGWDIERPGGGISKFDMPGGDFLDTRY
jgi:hypothetical protein